jgi:Sec-independent protein secretion pathway component TatC
MKVRWAVRDITPARKPTFSTTVTIAAIKTAVITPSGDPYTMLAMMIPMYVFYEASILVGRAMKR